MAKSRKRKNSKYKPSQPLPAPPPAPPPERPFFFLLAPVLLAVIVLFTYKSQDPENRLLPISVVALTVGVIFEYRAINGSWWQVFMHCLAALAMSLAAFIKFKREQIYNLEDHLRIWPYAFMASLVLIALIFAHEKATMKLNEGVILLQSLAIVYWVVDHGFLQNAGILLGIVMIGGLIFALYSLFHALSPRPHTYRSRLVLSIWSAVIFVLFTIDNFIRVYQNKMVEQTTELSDGLYIALQFFLLGVSAIYAAQNLMMLIEFLPERGRGFGGLYRHTARELKDAHVKRFSEEQMGIVPALICICFTAILFTLNYYYHFLPRHILIWIVFFLFPYLMKVFSKLTT